MRKKRLRRLVSEYHDGKCRRPEKVRKLIETDPETAAYLQELQALSSQLRSLPSPQVSPNFSVRVMRNIAQIGLDTERVRPRWQWVGLPAAAAALLVIAAVLFLEVYTQDTPSSSNTQSHQYTAIDPDALSEVILTRVAQGEELPWQGEAFDILEPNTTTNVVASDAADGAVYSPEVFGRMLATLDEESDLYAVVESLENGEAGAMRDLLAEYVLEG